MYRAFSRGGRGLTTIKTKAYRDWQARAIGLIASQRWRPVAGAYSLEIVLPKGNRIDADNTAKSFLDCLRSVGVVVDDSPKYLRRLEIRHGDDDYSKLIITPLGGPDAMDDLGEGADIPDEGRPSV